MSVDLDQLMQQLRGLPAPELQKLAEAKAASAPVWIPNPGPQTEAYLSKADVLLYGGQGGGGKSDLGLGLAFTQHQRSLIMRRRYADLSGLTERAIEINGTKEGYNGQAPPLLRTSDGRYIQFGANQHLGDERSWQGRAYDLKYVDECTQWLEQQVRFHLGWLRSATIGQRTRAVLGTNPPTDADGMWVIGMFRPWLDITHPKPAKPGELRWFATAPNGEDVEVDVSATAVDAEGRRFAELAGERLFVTSRTFIPASVSSNPFLAKTNYVAQLDALPEPIRSAVRDGNFMAARADADFQVIPTQWVLEAQARWTSGGGRGVPMTAMAFDPAGGGADAAELIWRHGGWYSAPVTARGEDTADGSAAAATIFKHRRDNAPVVIDVGGGYGGAVTMRLADNSISFIGFNGGAAGHGKTADRQLTFANARAAAWWKFREALDPDQPGGSPIALPPDTELRSDLTTPTFKVTLRGLLIESKDEIRKRIGRSPGKGDAAVMCLSQGDVAVAKALRDKTRSSRPAFATVGHAHAKRRR